MITKVATRASVAFILVVLVVLLLHPIPVGSQSNLQQQQLSKVIEDVLKAESAGAGPEEMGKLVAGLNSVLNLENQLQKPPPQDSNQQSQLLSQITSTLASVDAEANQIETIASHRTFTNHVATYSLGAFAAFLATVIFHYVILLRRRNRVKRVLRMKIIAK
ncbi:MAG TPA: hypothetical protein VJZ03_08365 [Candidatus Bathyarchaeia archaeon]|nr:hypothetical protein [Candidatus Bathyarchaeia archaeon]